MLVRVFEAGCSKSSSWRIGNRQGTTAIAALASRKACSCPSAIECCSCCPLQPPAPSPGPCHRQPTHAIECPDLRPASPALPPPPPHPPLKRRHPPLSPPVASPAGQHHGAPREPGGPAAPQRHRLARLQHSRGKARGGAEPMPSRRAHASRRPALAGLRRAQRHAGGRDPQPAGLRGSRVACRRAAHPGAVH